MGAPGSIQWPALSTDGKRVAVTRDDAQTSSLDIWIHDLANGAATRFGPQGAGLPVWSPGGSHIAFAAYGDGHFAQQATSGLSLEEPLYNEEPRFYPSDWSPDGRYIVGNILLETGPVLRLLPLFGTRKLVPYLPSQASPLGARVSPNGKWLAYVSNDTKQNEVYVQTFPTPGGQRQVSTNGGSVPVWSRDGKELFFVSAGKMMVVEVKAGQNFEVGAPRPLFDVVLTGSNPRFEVSKDGRFLLPMLSDQAPSVPIQVIVNWTAGLKK